MKRVFVFLLLAVLTASAWSQGRTGDSFPKALFGASIEPGYFYEAVYHPNYAPFWGDLAWSFEGPGIVVGLEQGVQWARWFRTSFLLEFDVSYWLGVRAFLEPGFAGRLSAVLGFALGPVLIEPLVGIGFPDLVSVGLRVGAERLPVLVQVHVGGGGNIRYASIGVVLRIGT